MGVTVTYQAHHLPCPAIKAGFRWYKLTKKHNNEKIHTSKIRPLSNYRSNNKHGLHHNAGRGQTQVNEGRLPAAL